MDKTAHNIYHSLLKTSSAVTAVHI